ncbi:MAG: hypothetical protein EOP38_02890 [Rubrivivax sp.]|nr:MAG: hypothetical protein EOP38_02890 [Rubrivivax sp.]
MIRGLRRRTAFRIALVAVAALLWSQQVLAGHAACLMHASNSTELVAQHDGCEEAPAPSADPVCTAHCSHGEASAEGMRLPSVPPLLAAVAIPFVSIIVLAPDRDDGVLPRVDSSPPPSWHRPTAHPAALLLI